VFADRVEATVETEHDDVRFTVDGNIPHERSAKVAGPIVITNEGKHVLTVAMFVDGEIIGNVVRRIYEVRHTKLPIPVVMPPSGTYPVPLHLTIQSDTEVRYTVNGAEPDETSSKYQSPILITKEGELILKCCSVLKKKTSEVVTSRYLLVASGIADSPSPANQFTGDPSPMVTQLPLENVEYDDFDEEQATEAVESTLGWMMASADIHDEAVKEQQKWRQRVLETKKEYKRQLQRLEVIQNALRIASARKAALLSAMRQESDMERKIKDEVASLQSSQLLLHQKSNSMDAQLAEARSLFERFTGELHDFVEREKSLRRRLEDQFLVNKKKLALMDPRIVEDVEENTLALAEQRHEIWLLQEANESLKRTLRAGSPGISQDATESEFLTTRNVVDIPVVEAVVSIPAGRMRLVTNASGTGLTRLRKQYKVQAAIVNAGDGLGIRVYGHARGVHNFVAAVGDILNAR
jgi:hypothetical protein